MVASNLHETTLRCFEKICFKVYLKKQKGKLVLLLFHACSKIDPFMFHPGNMRNVNDFGSYCPQYDRPEQGLDLLTEAIASAGLTPGTINEI